MLDVRDRQVLDVLNARAAEGAPATLAGQLTALGFTDTVDFGPEQALIRYFADRTDGLVAPRLSRLMKARVGGVSEPR